MNKNDDFRKKLYKAQEEARAKKVDSSYDAEDIIFKQDASNQPISRFDKNFHFNDEINDENLESQSKDIEDNKVKEPISANPLKDSPKKLRNQSSENQKNKDDSNDVDFLTDVLPTKKVLSGSTTDKIILVSLFVMALFAIFSLDIIPMNHTAQTVKSDNFTYKGGINRGVYNGPAEVSFTDGSTLTGDFKDGKLFGKYTFTDKNKTKVNGITGPEKQADISLDNGDKLDYQNGRYSTKSKDYTYTGEWNAEGLNYNGEVTFANTAHYVGEFSLGVPNGLGTYTAVDGQIFQGHFLNGVIDSNE
jgi:Uncharacterized protein conserved in bacteria